MPCLPTGRARPLALLALAALGCQDTPLEPVDEGTPAIPPDLGSVVLDRRAPLGERELRILSASRVQLGFAASTELQVALSMVGGVPAPGERVSFALVGRSQDASLAALDVYTDDAGEATTTLLAGEVAATFEVRVSASGALDRHVQVAVGDSGFGSLQVEAPYAGQREVSERVLVVQAHGDCDDVERSAGDPSLSLVGEQTRGEFLALPARVPYAVSGEALGPTGVVVARGCVDDVVIEPRQTLEVALDWSDEALRPAAVLELAVALDGAAPASWLSGVLSGAAEQAVTRDAEGKRLGSDAEARFLLDSLDAELRDAKYADDPAVLAYADALIKARADAGGALEQSLRSSLFENGEGPLSAIDALSVRARAALTRLALDAGVEVADGEEPGTYVLLVQTRELRALDAQGGRVARVTMAEVASSAEAARVAGEDALEVTALSLRVALGSLTTQLLRALQALDPDADPEAPAARMGWETFVQWLPEQAVEGGAACDEACLSAACERAWVRILAAAEPALLVVDDSRPELRLEGRLTLHDDDGDLLADVVRGELLSGTWPSATTGGSGAVVTGVAEARAVVAEE